MSPPTGEKRTKLDDFRDHLDRRFDSLDTRLSSHGERLSAVETEVRSMKSAQSGVVKWISHAVLVVAGWFIGTKT